ncbi:S1C family serine protease [Nocardioides speluncae]|uniref:S1C family serine protease n=1 Tax=Nocardioides speluncae TaxID=2670337 RepID=UPI000D693AB8|nr:trypsin-like peptidase domain-containing protein [Nocardioides speluncae]
MNDDDQSQTQPIPPTPAAQVATTYVAAPPSLTRPPSRRPVVIGTLAGLVTGTVLAAAVAVPTTWALTKDDQASNGTDDRTSASEDVDTPNDGIDRFPQPEWGPGGAQQPSGTKASEEQSEGVVLIDTTLQNGAGAGTGMILDEDGTILTNYHVVEDSTSVKVTVASTGDTYDAEVLGYDESADVALLDIDADELTPVTIDDDEVDVGDDVTAVGNGGGQGFLSAADGEVLAEDQPITASDAFGGDAENLTGLIQTDAAAVSGYSGGPTFDDEGEVIGITTAANSGGGFAQPTATSSESYAVPIDDALAIAEKIESGDEDGSVTVGPAAYLGVGVDDGLGILQVEDGSPAAKAGLEVGDTLLAIGDEETDSVDALQSAVAEHEVGDEVSITWRDASGQRQEAEVTLAESPVN